MTITSGTITFGLTRNLGDYNSAKAEASFGFTVPDGESADRYADVASVLAYTKVQALLDGKVKPAAETNSATVETRKKPGPKAKAPAPTAADVPPPAAPATKAATDMVEDATVVEETPAPQIRTNPENRVNPAEITDDDDLLIASAPEVTDKELQDAVAKKNAKLKAESMSTAKPYNSLIIKQLYGEYIKPGQQITQIPAAARPAFLKKLEAITL